MSERVLEHYLSKKKYIPKRSQHKNVKNQHTAISLQGKGRSRSRFKPNCICSSAREMLDKNANSSDYYQYSGFRNLRNPVTARKNTRDPR